MAKVTDTNLDRYAVELLSSELFAEICCDPYKAFDNPAFWKDLAMTCDSRNNYIPWRKFSCWS